MYRPSDLQRHSLKSRLYQTSTPLWSPQLLTLAGTSLMGNTYRRWVSRLLADPYHSDRGAHKWPDVCERGSDWCLAGKTKADSVNKDESRARSSVKKRLGLFPIFYFGEAGHGILWLWLPVWVLSFLVIWRTCSVSLFQRLVLHGLCLCLVISIWRSNICKSYIEPAAEVHLQEVQRRPVTLTGCPGTLKTV